jgi:ATP-dependent clp protease
MPIEIYYSPELNEAFHDSFEIAQNRHHEYVTPEHFILALLRQEGFSAAIKAFGPNAAALSEKIDSYLGGMETLPSDDRKHPETSMQFRQMLETAAASVHYSGKTRMGVPHAVKGLLSLEESFAEYMLRKAIFNKEGEFMGELVSNYETTDTIIDNLADPEEEEDDDFREPDAESWKNMVTCVNENLDNRNPLIGREAELERTIQVLCRKEKNNPLHVGEPGVGKTALVYGLARLIESGHVPERLKDARIYQIEIGNLLAGTQYRGDFENRIKTIMDGLSKEPGAILYIDEIHNLVGAGATGASSMDASNMLKPYLEAGDIRFIGSTTYEEYNRYFAKSKGIVRRFQQIDIAEPSVEETINIIRQLKKNYEKFHNVLYSDQAIVFAVTASARHITDRFLPDKAIDLIDEAGAFREIHPLPQKRQSVSKELVAEILSKVCKVDALAMRADDNAPLETLHERISSQIFGQDAAVKQVTEAVQMAKAGLTDDGKPLASLLFVGPTGVGKTEVARVLARELGIGLVRFDMSEYAEKHTVAKLIGSPAGYVGYEDGGLLTDAIRKTPNCVLLLDEIEKAHSDIYNILLQVMDYARLTDNKGNHADFRNVILIMTSNAGAQFAAQAKVGFGSNVTAGDAMMRQVKKTFKPEFINRLSATVVFNEMNRKMASLILEKNLRKLREMLAGKKVTLLLSEDASRFILDKGFTREYGARELERVINSDLKPLLMREILFGKLKKGGEANVVVNDGKLSLI